MNCYVVLDLSPHSQCGCGPAPRAPGGFGLVDRLPAAASLGDPRDRHQVGSKLATLRVPGRRHACSWWPAPRGAATIGIRRPRQFASTWPGSGRPGHWARRRSRLLVDFKEPFFSTKAWNGPHSLLSASASASSRHRHQAAIAAPGWPCRATVQLPSRSSRRSPAIRILEASAVNHRSRRRPAPRDPRRPCPGRPAASCCGPLRNFAAICPAGSELAALRAPGRRRGAVADQVLEALAGDQDPEASAGLTALLAPGRRHGAV